MEERVRALIAALNCVRNTLAREDSADVVVIRDVMEDFNKLQTDIERCRDVMAPTVTNALLTDAETSDELYTCVKALNNAIAILNAFRSAVADSANIDQLLELLPAPTVVTRLVQPEADEPTIKTLHKAAKKYSGKQKIIHVPANSSSQAFKEFIDTCESSSLVGFTLYGTFTSVTAWGMLVKVLFTLLYLRDAEAFNMAAEKTDYMTVLKACCIGSIGAVQIVNSGWYVDTSVSVREAVTAVVRLLNTLNITRKDFSLRVVPCKKN